MTRTAPEFPLRSVLVAAIVALCGCAPLATVSPDGLVERHYFGYVKVLVPDSFSKSSHVSALDTTAVGIRIESGLGVGYFRDKEIVTPLDCRLVVVVRNKQQLDQAVKFLSENLKGDSACAVIDR